MFMANRILLLRTIQDQAGSRYTLKKLKRQCSDVALLLHCFVFCSHSDANGTIKEDDKSVLLEGGQLKSPSTKFRNLSTKANLLRYRLNTGTSHIRIIAHIHL
jgi:hypothetical protein